jgi:hypothetical protein
LSIADPDHLKSPVGWDAAKHLHNNPFLSQLKARGVRPIIPSGATSQQSGPKKTAVLTGSAPLRRENPNHWRAITRLDVAVSGNGISAAEDRISRFGQHHLVNPTMTRDDLLVWLSFAWFVALCGAAIWVLFPF